ncbi:10491_t:CDS:1, partial [Entrophospora sp. SA101]
KITAHEPKAIEQYLHCGSRLSTRTLARKLSNNATEVSYAHCCLQRSLC